MSTTDLETASLENIASSLRSGGLSASAIAEWSISNHAARGDTFHAYKTFDADRIRAEATLADNALAVHNDSGPLLGIPISVKDLFGVAGYPTFAGCPRELPEKWRHEGPVIRALRNQLAVISGKSHTVQFAYGGLGANPHWGPPRNPWDPDDHRSPGGSSSGAGVSLWEGSALLAIGSDTAGSVRIPASMTGTAGIRPTAGRWSTDGIVPLSPSLDTAGVLARSVADMAIGFAAIDPRVEEDAIRWSHRLADADLADFRVGVCDWYFDDCDPGIADGVRTALRELERAGLRTVSHDMPQFEAATEVFRQGGLHVGDFTSFINGEMADYRADLDPAVAIRFEKMETMPASGHVQRVRRLTELTRQAHDAYGGLHALVGPTLPLTPPKMADIADPEAHLRANMRTVRNTNTASLLGMCAVTLPVALDSAGMPVALHIVARGGDEKTALALALACERALGTAQDRIGAPPMCRK
ncbi:MAG: amidase [Alphaproteobacteria bacterium]|jgi:aspartyl-tRNA(Asn)/glutamyl-tRNA(Gln) amidotransferase subunit A